MAYPLIEFEERAEAVMHRLRELSSRVDRLRREMEEEQHRADHARPEAEKTLEDASDATFSQTGTRTAKDDERPESSTFSGMR